MFSLDAKSFSKGVLLSTLFSIEINLAWASPSLNSNARRDLPAGWTSLGCYTDSTSSRTLRTASYTSVNSMTIESCLAFCTPGGYQYAGVEYARECYCDNTIRSPGAPANTADCNMPCTGNAAEFCGAGNRINIYSNGTPTTSTSTATPTATPTIVPHVGTWDYKGCYVDIGPRDLSHQLTNIPGGVTAATCTAACKAAGYGLAGLEYGQECWCDNYLPYGDPAPDSQCNKPCVANTSELCGEGNRLAVYQDSTATPLSPDTCITGRSFFNFHLQAVPVDSSGGALAGGVTRQIYAVTLNFNLQNTVEYTILSACNNCPVSFYNFGMNNAIVTPYGLFGPPQPVAPVVGSAQVFIAFSATSITPYAGFCAKPNPISPNGTFIGFPALSVSGHSDKWALCTNTTAGGRVDVVYSPIATSPDYSLSGCQNVVLQMSQPYAFIH